jgi:hypothetical protein
MATRKGSKMRNEKLDEFCLQQAIDYVLTEYPYEKSPQEIIEMISGDDMEDIEVWEDYEDYSNSSVVNVINEKAYTFATMIKEWEETK